MQINVSYEDEFTNLLTKLDEKYGKKIMELEGLDGNLDLNKISEAYFSTNATVDVTVDPNANVDDNTVLGYIVESGKPALRLNSLYKMWKTIKKLYGPVAAAEAIEAEVSGEIYVHDMTGYGIRSYCWATSIMDIVALGLPFINRVHSLPPKHLTTFIQHVVQTVMFMSNQIDGAVAIPDLFVAMAYFIRKDIESGHLPDPKKNKEMFLTLVKQQLQILIYTLNQPVRQGQSPYTNVSILDKGFLNGLFADLIFPDGSSAKDYFDEINEIQDIFMDVMEDEMNRQILTFPVITATISVKDRDSDNPIIIDPAFVKKISKRLVPHANFNIYVGETTALSSCCRLRSDLTDTYMNSFGAANSVKIGSHRVCTINLPRVALVSSTKEEIFENLDKSLKKAYNALTAHRYIVRDMIHKNKLPLYHYGLMDLNRQFSTFGIIGIYEMVDLMGIDPLSEEGLNTMEEILNHINGFISKKNGVKTEQTYIIEFKDGTAVKRVIDSKISVVRGGEKTSVNVSQVKYNDIIKNKRVKSVKVIEEQIVYTYNVEQIPGESAAVKLLNKDRLIFQIKELDKYQLYSNQFVPLHIDMPIPQRMAIHGRFDSKTGGGAILHVNVAEKINSEEVMERIIDTALHKNVIYFAINYNFQKCENDHYTVGSKAICPECGGKIIEELTRVVGFITPKKNWSRERKTEQRKWTDSTKI